MHAHGDQCGDIHGHPLWKGISDPPGAVFEPGSGTLAPGETSPVISIDAGTQCRIMFVLCDERQRKEIRSSFDGCGCGAYRLSMPGRRVAARPMDLVLVATADGCPRGLVHHDSKRAGLGHGSRRDASPLSLDGF